ncbi:MAG: CpsB/CapC family capsule biosynthesis tyrosine phosphatase, partial [Ardenticatenaceae bacterium]
PPTEAVIFHLQRAGYTILLAHPERYRAVANSPNLIFALVEKGVYMQVTSASILGRFGAKPRETARLLLEHNLAHVLASDAHDARGRHPRLLEAYGQVSAWIGERAARRLVVDIPRSLLHDEAPEVADPCWIESAHKRKRFVWL